MATSREQLRREIALLIDRADATVQTSEIDNVDVDYLDIFIRNAEKRIYRDEVARTPPFEFVQTTTLNPGDSTLAVPRGYLEIRYVEAVQGNTRRILNRTSVDEVRNADIEDRVEIADEFAYGSNQFFIRPITREATINIYYYGELTPIADLTGPITDHELLNNYDDLIRYYAAVEAALYYGSDDLSKMAQLWELKAKDIRDEIVSQNRRARRSGGSQRMGRGHYRNPPRIGVNVGQFGRR